MSRPYKEYKEGDWIELTKLEQTYFHIGLLIQTAAVEHYIRLSRSPVPSPSRHIAIAKEQAQFCVRSTWQLLQKMFPGLGNQQSFAQEEEDLGKIERFMVISIQTAVEKLSGQPDGDRVYTPEWEQMIKEYRDAHGIRV